MAYDVTEVEQGTVRNGEFAEHSEFWDYLTNS